MIRICGLSQLITRKLGLAYKISKICTFKGYLPQGAPTSPVISNIVFKAVDEEITEICKKRKVIYSRYADDLTFSTNNKQYLIDLIKPITEIVKKHGFKINSEKTRLYSGKRRMSVTGVILNSGRLTVGRDLKRNIRAGLYNVIVKNDKKINKKVLMGYISFIKDIEPDYFESIKKYKNKLLLEVGNK